MSLEDKLKETSDTSRLNAIDEAYKGNPYQGSNFKATWQGYDDDGHAQVKYQDRTYTASNIGGRSAKSNQKVVLRVAKGKKQINY
jgi:hypothetical protein|tara:strand:- start:226 stop:480 length:255 start_codon:yes stop_codon:yes gene_type:complete